MISDYWFFVHSITMKMYQGQQRPTPTEADRLNTTAVGSQELSGYSENNDRFVAQPDDYKRFTTHYLTRYAIVWLWLDLKPIIWL